ncbi:MAG: DUF4230 domain-containing protein [Lachnospiraceae bacterium]|nr:DUF4230 domain-containing protein [Lachnospiraceae bacterium]
MSNGIKTLFLNCILLLSIIGIIGVSAFGTIVSVNDKKNDSKNTIITGFDDDEVYHVDKKTTIDFYEPIMEQFNKESQLVVSSAQALIELEIKQTGIIDIAALNKTQKIKYRGIGRFYIDMSELTKENINVDEETKVITITVPHSKLLPVEIDPNQFESEDARKGFLAFGDLKFTPKEYNDLQVEVKTKLEKGINIKENRIKADENAIEEITKIYEPIVKSLDEEYEVCVQFDDTLGGKE